MVKSEEVVARHAGGELRLADIIHHHRPDDAGRRPRCEQPAVNRADELRAEHVGEMAGTVEKPPPYIDRMMQKAPTNRSLLPICAKNGADA